MRSPYKELHSYKNTSEEHFIPMIVLWGSFLSEPKGVEDANIENLIRWWLQFEWLHDRCYINEFIALLSFNKQEHFMILEKY